MAICPERRSMYSCRCGVCVSVVNSALKGRISQFSQLVQCCNERMAFESIKLCGYRSVVRCARINPINPTIMNLHGYLFLHEFHGPSPSLMASN